MFLIYHHHIIPIIRPKFKCGILLSSHTFMNNLVVSTPTHLYKVLGEDNNKNTLNGVRWTLKAMIFYPCNIFGIWKFLTSYLLLNTSFTFKGFVSLLNTQKELICANFHVSLFRVQSTKVSIPQKYFIFINHVVSSGFKDTPRRQLLVKAHWFYHILMTFWIIIIS